VETPLNESAAWILRDCAELLRQQHANPFRVNAYIRAAETLESLPGDVREILSDEGIDGLMQLPFIGRGLASSIAEIIHTGRLSQLDRWRGETDPEQLFQTVPGIGPLLADAIHNNLHFARTSQPWSAARAPLIASPAKHHPWNYCSMSIGSIDARTQPTACRKSRPGDSTRMVRPGGR